MKNDLKNIILKSILYRLDTSEQAILDEWFDECESNRRVYEKVRKLNKEQPMIDFLQSIDSAEALIRVKEKLGSSMVMVRKKNQKPLIYTTVAASVAALFFFSFLIFMQKDISVVPTPSTTKAQLILSTGESIELGSASLNKKVGNSEIAISNKSIVFSKTGEDSGARKIVMNTLSVPHGENFNLTLSDGTKVWVNAMTRMKFPTEFGMKRVVELDGEAYFEVAKDPNRPFIVKMKEYDIQVVGTSFNVSNYQNEGMTRTTLCSGLINVLLNDNTKQQIQLTPGNQLSINKHSREMKIEEVNADNYSAWRNGSYYFENQPLEELFNSLKKWYNIESVEFENEYLKKKLYSGKFDKKSDFNKILTIIEYGADCIIIRKGEKLKIMKK